MRFSRNQHIEELAAQRLSQREQLVGKSLTPPLPLERFVEGVLGLDFLWDHIAELPGEKIFGGLKATSRLIVLNEVHHHLFEACE